jgi:hypothetical protein
MLLLLPEPKKETTGQIMKPSKILLAIIAAMACVGPLSSAQASLITGMLNISGTATYDLPIANATQITMFTDVVTGGANTGDFSGIGAMVAVTMTAPYVFNPSTPTPALWSVAGFTFDLLTSQIITQSNNGILITGTGIISGNGFDPTPGTWGFSQQKGSGTVLTFSATTEAVPDGGMTLALLGVGLIGLAAFRAKFAKV